MFLANASGYDVPRLRVGRIKAALRQTDAADAARGGALIRNSRPWARNEASFGVPILRKLLAWQPQTASEAKNLGHAIFISATSHYNQLCNRLI